MWDPHRTSLEHATVALLRRPGRNRSASLCRAARSSMHCVCTACEHGPSQGWHGMEWSGAAPHAVGWDSAPGLPVRVAGAGQRRQLKLLADALAQAHRVPNLLHARTAPHT